MNRQIATVTAHVEGEAACGRIRIDRGIINDNIAVVVGQGVRTVIAPVVQRQSHAFQRQVAVVLDQKLRFRRCNSTILESNLVVLEQLESVRLGAGAADHGAIHRIGMATKVHRQASAELALRNHNAIARAILKQGDGIAILRRRKGRFEGSIRGGTNLRHGLGNRLGAITIVNPGIAFRRGLVKVARFCNGSILGTIPHQDVAAHSAAIQRKAVALCISGGVYDNVTIDRAVSGDGNADRRIGGECTDAKSSAANSGWITDICPRKVRRIDRGILDYNCTIAIAHSGLIIV